MKTEIRVFNNLIDTIVKNSENNIATIRNVWGYTVRIGKKK